MISKKKKISGQRADKSFSEDEEETEEQHQNLEFATTTVASAQEEEVPPQEPTNTQAPPMKMEQDIQAPLMDMLTPSITETFTLEPTVSQAYIENQIRQLTESLSTSISSMFEKLTNQWNIDFKI